MTGPTSQGASPREMCELVAEFLRVERGFTGTPEDIWNHSPTGELSLVFSWYDVARRWKALQTPIGVDQYRCWWCCGVSDYVEGWTDEETRTALENDMVMICEGCRPMTQTGGKS